MGTICAAPVRRKDLTPYVYMWKYTVSITRKVLKSPENQPFFQQLILAKVKILMKFHITGLL